jgi:hypothetical protein
VSCTAYTRRVFFRRSEEPEPIGRAAGVDEYRRTARTSVLGTGTLACPACDLPVALGGRAVAPAAALDCPFCGHAGAVRDFLSLVAPTRPARVRVRVVMRAAGSARARR